MTKVTDRLDNQNLINLARQQFEEDKRKKLPSAISFRTEFLTQFIPQIE